jgi:transposase
VGLHSTINCRALFRGLANEARVTLDRPHPSAELAPAGSGTFRNCFAAIMFMARMSTLWRLLPAQELGCGSPATCWRRLTEWAAAGVFDQLHLAVLDRLGEQGQVDWSRASVDSSERAGPAWGDQVGANPVDRGKPGSKLHLVCDGGGLPLTAVVTAAQRQ